MDRIGTASQTSPMPMHASVITEQCPWCGTKIPRTKFLEIQTRIREEEQKKLEQERKKLEAANELQLQKEILKVRQQEKLRAEKQIRVLAQEKDKALQQRDLAMRQQKDKGATIRKQAQEEADQKAKQEVAKARRILEEDKNQSLLKQEGKFAREKDEWARKMKQLQLKLEQQRANELGDGAEVDAYDALREAFPTDKITRIKKGEPGADIRHEVLYKGEVCGTILYDSKNRQLWQNAFAKKLHNDQIAAKADHAILATTAFPSGKKELCVRDGVIVINPARVTSLVELLRTWIIRMHILGLTEQKRNDKTAKLYEFITSEMFNRQCKEVERLTNELLDLDVGEKKQHDRVWSTRGEFLTRLKRVHGEMETHVAAILEGVDG